MATQVTENEVKGKESGALVEGGQGQALAAVPEESVWLANFISPRTRATYQRAVASFAAFAGITSAEAFREVNQAQVLAWREHLIAEGMAARTVGNRMAALSSIFNHLCEKQLVKSNPVKGLQRPRLNQAMGETPAIDKKLVRAMLDAAERDFVGAKTEVAQLQGARDSAMLHVFFFMGCRISELCQLRVKDQSRDGAYPVLVFTLKGGKRNKVPMPHEVVDKLGRYLMLAGHGDERHYPLFRRVRLDSGDRPITRLAAYNVFKKYARAVGLPEDAVPHSARATFATESLNAGALLEHVQQVLGHTSISTTKIYDRRQMLHRESPTLVVRYD
jgi:integrase/recombinase XerD